MLDTNRRVKLIGDIEKNCRWRNRMIHEFWMLSFDIRHARDLHGYATIGSIGDGMAMNSVIPSPIFETLRDSEDTLRTTLAELAEDKRKQKPNISERKLAEYLADQMGYRGAKNVEALIASRERIAKSRQAVGLSSK
jgi:hypothetical protein